MKKDTRIIFSSVIFLLPFFISQKLKRKIVMAKGKSDLQKELEAKEKEFAALSKDTNAEPEKVKTLQAEIEILKEDISAIEQQAAAKSAKYTVKKEIAKDAEKHGEYFKQAAAKFPAEAVEIVSFAENKEAKTFTVVLHAEKQGLRKIEFSTEKK